MKKSRLAVAVLLIIPGIALLTGAQQTKKDRDLAKTYPLLSRLDISENALPKGCTKPNLRPEDFPLKGIRQCTITTDPRAIAAMEKRHFKVGAKNIEAIYFAVYKEANELGVIGCAFINPEIAKKAYKNLTKGQSFFKIWLSGKYVIVLWHDKGTTEKCMQQMKTLIEKVVQSSDKKND